MIKAPFGLVWTLVGAATPFSTWSLTRPHAWTRGASGFPCSRGAGKRGPRPAPDPLPGPAHRPQQGDGPRRPSNRVAFPLQDLIAEGGTQIVWEDRWHEEEIFANRLSFYILAQSFLIAAAVTATLSSDATSRWLPVALTIDLAGLALTIVFWYALTENLRRLDALKELVAEGSRELGVRGYREIGVVRTAHHERRARRGLPFPLSILPRWSPSWWLAHGIPILLGGTWIALIAVAILTA